MCTSATNRTASLNSTAQFVIIFYRRRPRRRRNKIKCYFMNILRSRRLHRAYSRTIYIVSVGTKE